MIRYVAPAKINLFLHILGKLPNGYHALESIFVFAKFGDIIKIRPAATRSLTVMGPLAASLREIEPEQNLVLRAAKALAEAAKTQQGAEITLIKNLPSAAGLGGGSSDAAATLKALAAFWQLDLPDEALAEIGLTLGADIPACLYGKSCYVEGLGEKITPLSSDALVLLLITPPCPLSTAWAYQQLHPPYTVPLASIPAGPLFPFLHKMHNDMQPAAILKEPIIQTVLDSLLAQPGCILARMSGSGPSCFGIFSDFVAAEAAALAVKKRYPGWWVCPTTTQ